MSKKSQSALEFLINYAWALIVILVVVGAFLYIFVPFNRVSPPKCILGAGIACLGTEIRTNDATIRIRNGLEPVMYVSSTEIIYEGTSVSCTTDSIWLIDKDYTIRCRDLISLGFRDNAKLKMTIKYKKETTGLTRTIGGEIFNYVKETPQYKLDTSFISGALGSGTITSDDGMINCPGDCDEIYYEGTILKLIATPAVGYGWDGWDMDLSSCGANTECTVTMSANITTGGAFT